MLKSFKNSFLNCQMYTKSMQQTFIITDFSVIFKSYFIALPCFLISWTCISLLYFTICLQHLCLLSITSLFFLWFSPFFWQIHAIFTLMIIMDIIHSFVSCCKTFLVLKLLPPGLATWQWRFTKNVFFFLDLTWLHLTCPNLTS